METAAHLPKDFAVCIGVANYQLEEWYEILRQTDRILTYPFDCNGERESRLKPRSKVVFDLMVEVRPDTLLRTCRELIINHPAPASECRELSA